MENMPMSDEGKEIVVLLDDDDFNALPALDEAAFGYLSAQGVTAPARLEAPLLGRLHSDAPSHFKPTGLSAYSDGNRLRLGRLSPFPRHGSFNFPLYASQGLPPFDGSNKSCSLAA